MTSESRQVNHPRVGQRLRRGTDRGTIRYIGSVPPTSGTWLGVEWDADIGKHDGSHKGVRYFECRLGAGSFIRLSRSLSFGTSFLHALHHKYVASLADLQTEGSNASTSYSRKTLADIEVETPNIAGVFRRAAQLDRRKEVVLDGPTNSKVPTEEDQADAETVGSSGDVAYAYDAARQESPGDIARTCSDVRWLDLSRSLLPDWEEVAIIARDLSKLETLLLQSTRLATTVELDPQAFLQLRDLRLDDTLTTAAQAWTIIKAMPRLQNLSLGHNAIESLVAPTCPEIEAYPLTALSLEANKLENWQGIVSSLCRLSNLQRVTLSSNRIATIPAPSAGDPRFPSLQHISLSDNLLSSWSDIDHLNQWTKIGVTSLVLDPQSISWMASMDVRDTRALLIARLPALQTLNHGAVSAAERRDAELYYMSAIEKIMSGQSDETRATRHPRWLSLVAKYGRTETIPLEQSKHNTDRQTLRSKLLPLRVHLAQSAPSGLAPHIASPLPIDGVSIDAAEATSVVVDLLPTTPLRMLLPKLARSLNLRQRGGVRAIASVWALLSAQIDPAFDTAVHLRSEMRPAEDQDPSERIVFELDSLERDLSGYNIGPADELVVVLN